MEGCFDKWPKHLIDPYIDQWKIDKGKSNKVAPKDKRKRKERETVWYPNGTGKTYQTPSVLGRRIHISTNAKTWRNMKPVTYTREFI